jgi:putative toxin-antitoxin system antitoxin component (TIGR02293 family)
MYICGVKKYRTTKQKPAMVSEPLAIYQSYGSIFQNPLSIALQAVEGLRAQALDDFERLSGLSKQMVARFLHVTSRSLNRYVEEDRVLDASKSEALLKLMALYKKGTDVFGSKEEFNRWLSRPSMGLANHVPFDLMETSSGIDLIDEELDRIAYGDVL